VASTAVTIGTQLVVIGLIGRIGGDALYVRSLYTPVAFLFLAVTTGLAVTLQVAVAQCRGRGEDVQIGRYFGGVARVGALVYIVLGVALVSSLPLLAAALRMAPDRRGTFHEFLVAMAGAALLGMVGELCAAVLRGLGRTGTAALVTFAYVGCYLCTAVVGGLLLRGGLMAVALGAALGALAEVCAGLTILTRGRVLGLRAFTAWRRGVPRLVAAIGVPVGSSYVVLCVVNLLLLRIVAPAGQQAVAGFSVGYMMQSTIIVPAVGLGSSIAVLMNQSSAAGFTDAARTIFRRGMLLALVGYLIITLVVVTAGGQLAGLMSGSPAIAAQAREFITMVGPTFGITALTLAAMTVLEQVGYGALAAFLNASYFAGIVSIGWLLTARSGNISDLYLTMRIAALCSLVTALPLVCFLALRPRVLTRASPQETARAPEGAT
jgi:Na+-driven multidrug efflux pump